MKISLRCLLGLCVLGATGCSYLLPTHGGRNSTAASVPPSAAIAPLGQDSVQELKELRRDAGKE